VDSPPERKEGCLTLAYDSAQGVAMDNMEKDVREFIRATEVLIARLKTGKPMSKNEIMLVQSYSLRTNSLASLLKSYDRLAEARKVTSGLPTTGPTAPLIDKFKVGEPKEQH
jgi:hypothetical protein